MKPKTTTTLVLLTTSVGIALSGSLNPTIAGRRGLFEQLCTTNPVVSSDGNSGGGTLRQAVADACAGSTITFSVTGTIPLSSGQITIDKDLTIQGPGAGVLTVQNTAARSTTSRIFYVNTGVTVTIAGLTISGGDIYGESSPARGGGIYNTGNLTVTGSIIRNNQAQSTAGLVGFTFGGGIFSTATLTISNSTISHNNVVGSGGGIVSSGTVNIDHSTISDNFANSNGGGLLTAGAVNITNSTISRNGTGLFGAGGGGIAQNGGTVLLTNSTVSGNVSGSAEGSGGGGGIYIFQGTLTVTNATITNNLVRTVCTFTPCSEGVGGGINNTFGSTVNSRNSIIAGNVKWDVWGSLTSQGYNLLGFIPFQVTGDTTGNILNQNPLLAPLADNGGHTHTHALLPNSPAIDAGDSSGSTTDQRGAFRGANQPPANASDGSDIGAFELGPDTTLTAGPTDPSNSSAPSFSFTGTDPFDAGIVEFECSLDGSGFTACLSPHAYSSLSDGSHTFVVRAIDNAGNRDGAPPSLAWTIDTAPPDTTIESRPSNPSGVNAPFSFSGTDIGTGVAGFECDLDGGGFFACESPQIYYGLPEGNHTVRIRAVDRAGNVDPTSPSFTWLVDPLICPTNPVVTNHSDRGVGSLRLAVADVCAGGTVTFDVTGAIPLSSGPITLGKNLTIQGPGAEVLAVQNGAAQSAISRIFVVNTDVTATIAGLTVSGGNVLGNGGGIFIANRAALTVTDSTISNNRASNNGGGIHNNFGTLTVTNSTISNNYSRFSGGGIHNLRLLPTDGVVTITNSTISNNEAVGDLDRGGGGLYNESGAMILTNSTVSGNRTVRIPDVGVPAHGGGIYTSGTLTLTHTTITNNSVADGGFGGGIFGIIGTMNSRNSIIAGNGGLNFFGSLTSQGYNLIGSPAGPITGDTTGNILNQNALLAPLADNGGPTYTHALLAGSPAIDAGDSSGSTTDQRGSSRPADQPPENVSDGADIGAFELGGVVDSNTPPSAANDAYDVNEGSTLNPSSPGVLMNDTDGENDPLTALLQTSPAHAAAFSLNADGSFSYTPNPNFNGVDSFTYSASDGDVASSAATVTITVNAVNASPDAVDDTATVAEDSGATAINVLGNDSTAPDTGETLTISAVTQGAHGSVAVTGGGTGVAYTPSANFQGTDSFTYTISDGNGGSDSATVSVTVTAVNDAPTMVDNAISRQQNAGIANTLIASVNDIDDAKATLIVTVNGSASATLNGVTLSNIAVNALGNVTADVAAGCGASNASFTLTVTDPGNSMATAAVNVTVTLETTPPVIDPIANVVADLPQSSSVASVAVTFPLPTAADGCSTATVTTSPASGSQFPIGTTTVTVTATDGVGNRSVSSFTVTVLYRFTGFFQPVDNLPTVNIITAGQGVSVQFSLSGYQGLNVVAPGYPISIPVACDASEPGDTVEETVTAGGSGLSYDSTTGHYGYVWKTSKPWKGTCRLFVMKLSDGSEHHTKFRFR